MTFLELQQAVYGDTGFKAAPPADVSTRVKRWLNEGHRTLLREPGLTGLRQGTIAIATVASQAIYGLPMAFERIDRIQDTTNDIPVRYRSRDWFRTVDPGERVSGNPYVWTDVGRVPVLMQPTTDGLWAASAAAGDTTQTARVIGITSNGDRQAQATAALNGTNRIQLGGGTGFATYVTVLKFTLSAAAVGAVSLYDAATLGNELARIPVGATSVNYQAIRLWPTPAAVLPYTIDGQFSVPLMSDDTDVPMLPDDWHDLIAKYARMREYERTGDKRYGIAKGEFDEGKAAMMYPIDYPADYTPIAGRLAAQGIGVSTLGSAYPAEFLLES